MRRGAHRRWERTVLSTAFVLLLGIFVGLGIWQLDRAEQKRRLFETFAAGGGMEPANRLIDDEAVSNQRYRPLELRGRYLSSKQILLEAMTHRGRVGYQVLTPFRPVDGERWVVVNRGWIDAASPGDLDVGQSERTIRGRIDTLPRPGLRLDPAETDATRWPQTLLYPTPEQVEAALGLPLARYQLLLDPAETEGFVRDWRPGTMPPERHVGYAVQWFGLALMLTVVAAVLLLRAARDARR